MGHLSSASHAPAAPAAYGRVTVNGVALAADCLGALYWRDEGALVVGAPHPGKGSSFARRWGRSARRRPAWEKRRGLRAARAVAAPLRPARDALPPRPPDRALRAARG